LKGLLLFALLFSAAPLRAHPDAAGERQDALLRDFLWDELVTAPAGERPRIGVAFSGGGARGYAHVGVIEALERAAFPVDVVAGTSMGALIGVAFADKLPAHRMRDLLVHADLSTGTNLNAVRMINMLIADSLLSTKPITRFLKSTIGDKRFDQLRRPFGCVATDIKTGEKIVFTEGDVAPAVRASINIPGIFEPVEYRQRYLVDGGIVDFLPVDVARQLGADWVLASVTEGDYTRSTFPNVLFTLEQVIDISGSILARTSKRAADFVMDPNVGRIRVYELERGAEAVEDGEIAAQRKIRPAQEELILFSMPSILKRLGA
jgi:NTE family protein